MRPYATLLPRLLRDRLARTVGATAFVLLLTSPLLRFGKSGFADGYMVGAEPGAASTANLVGLLLALVSPWLAEGVVSELRCNGSGPLMLTRPVSRPALYLVRWLAGLVSLTVVALVAAMTINIAWSASGGSGPGLSIVGSIWAGLVIWVWVGSTVLLLSALLDRGEALAGALLVAIPIAMTAALPSADLLARAARVLPVRPVLSAARTSLTGSIPEPSTLVEAGCWSLAMLGVGLFIASRRDWRAGD